VEIQALKLAYFSPTGTTKSIAQAIANGIKQFNVERIDVTRPAARKKQFRTSRNELLVVAVPVYLGRVPALLSEWLHAIKANKTPVVCVVVYGNRGYDDALLELKNTMKKSGGIPVACAAYIGEHSYSCSEMPIAEARPDAKDLNHAELFGRKIHEKLKSVSSIDHISDIDLPGSYPYRGDSKLWSIDFIAISNECTQCGTCAEVCPVGAIDPEDTHRIDKEKCITCCACIKNCPQNARMVKPSPVKDAAIRLNKLNKERKVPVLFFAKV
jgi:ferredoxin